MPGYNHYPDCACGWCVNYGWSRVSRTDIQNTFAYRDARSLLKQYNANSVAGCYVNPNARCPVCNAPVFFYANAAGSRVYFDDLGPPWPKHPCTDNGPQRISSTELTNRGPSRRPIGEVKELLAAAQRAGLSKPGKPGGKKEDVWSLAVVHAVRRLGNENQIEAEFLDTKSGGVFGFACYSDREFLSPGEFISVKGNQVSCVSRHSLSPTFFTFGGSVNLDGEPEPDGRKPPTSPLAGTLYSPKDARLIKRKKPRKSASANDKRDGDRSRLGPSRDKPGVLPKSKLDMQKSEMVHFESGAVTFEELYRRLEPVVKQLAREGTRKPKDVAPRLNFLGFRTADGSKWTPRLVYFLLALIFNDATSMEPRRNNTGKRSQTPARPTSRNRNAKGPTEPLTKESIAARLANLGTVSIKPNGKNK
ncbi:hypothetical protein [Roseibium polysiphoniae]|uniref:Replication protein n=1 Tax=Roseibium polysiphoniae TaxID=2571221 RepID=A0ABR9CDJ1_9HYPH|nr:hypothetical protein [Roseibium polysiphoniae]MBD8877663.1 hypothetical protein [Roseibium polysiphoniae]